MLIQVTFNDDKILKGCVKNYCFDMDIAIMKPNQEQTTSIFSEV